MTAQTDELIGRVLDGKASLEEIKCLAAWIQADERHRAYFRQWKKVWHLAHEHQASPERREEALRQFTTYMRRTEQAKRRRILVRLLSAVSGAAAIVALAFFTGLLENRQAPSEPGAMAHADKVQLVLTDGSRHILAEGETVQEIVAASDSCVSHGENLSSEGVTEAPEMKYNEIIVPQGTTYTLALADRSSVILNAGSRLKFPSVFAAAERRVFLSGEAYFSVARDEAHPFFVEFPAGSVRVLGTEFNVNAYAGGAASAVLVSGKVEVASGDETAVLRPGQLCEMGEGGLTVKEADLMVELAWKNGEFVFKGASWKQVMDELARWYDADIRYNESEMNELKLHIYMERTATLPAALEVISGIVDISYSVEGRKVLIKRR